MQNKNYENKNYEQEVLASPMQQILFFLPILNKKYVINSPNDSILSQNQNKNVTNWLLVQSSVSQTFCSLRTIKFGKKFWRTTKSLKIFLRTIKQKVFINIFNNYQVKQPSRGTMFIFADQILNLCGPEFGKHWSSQIF